MARPCKRRRVFCEPCCRHFAPADSEGNSLPPVIMTVDELESVRLIDLEGLSQEECAESLGIARSTAQNLYGRARLKIARCIVNGRPLKISGGEYFLCPGGQPRRKAACTGGLEYPAEENNDNGRKKRVRVAVTYENGKIFQHFGHTEEFKVYDIEDGRIVKSAVTGSDGQGHGALAGLLAGRGVDALICGGIGGGAQMALAEAGIRVYAGVSGDADAAVDALIAGTLRYQEGASCSHHGEGHSDCHGGGHSCH
ncbi:MAG: DUF134 domain-containing protein [Synergistes sp.]|nr:DUF134 domain-containing protein [Synergistes sp.]